MTGVLHKTGRSFAVAIAVALILGMLSPVTLKPGGLPPMRDNTVQHAAVTIKTQKAADSIAGGIRGIDVSHYQGVINWEKVAKDDVAFAMIRASIGKETDEKFIHNATKAHENGILVGAYHYAKFTDRATMRQEAQLFINQLKQVDITYPVALDVEATRGMSRNTLTGLCTEFMDLLRAAGYRVMLYSYTNFYRDYLNVSALDGYDLWVANYLEQPNSFAHKMWQHTSYGTVSGISGRVDINIAYEDLRANQKLKVSKTVSDSIKHTLNERYSAGLPLDSLDMNLMNQAIATGIHAEIERQLGADIGPNAFCDETTIEWLDTITYVPNQTNGNITYLLQVKLFYKGMYTGELTSRYDDSMVQALKSFQRATGLPANGSIDYDTLWNLLV